MTAPRPPRVLLVHRYFAPDTPPYAHILEAIAKDLAARGHQVTVLTCQPSYRRGVAGRAAAREAVDGYNITRWPVMDDRSSIIKKGLNLAWFCLRLALSRRAFRRADVVMAATTPPVVLAAVASLLARSTGARFVYHKQDIYPEVVTRGANGFVMRILRSIDARTDQRADRVVVLSEDMAEVTAERGADVERIEVINNFDPWKLGAPTETSSDIRGLVVVFAGNVGRFQGLDAVFQLIRRLHDEPRIVFHFYGDGARMDDLRALSASSSQVVLHGFAPASEVAEFVRTHAALGLVSLEAGVIRAAYPSKTMTYLRHGCPLLALVEQSELSQMIENEQIGIAGSTSELGLVEKRLRELASDTAGLAEARRRARAVYEERFAPERQLQRWADLFLSVASR